MLDWLPKVISAPLELLNLLRLTEARCGARVCDPQHVHIFANRKLLLATSLVMFAGVLCIHTAIAASVEIAVRPVVSGEPLQLGSLRHHNGAGENFSVTRLSYLLSGFAFQRPDGSWLELTNSVAWLDAEKERTSASVDVPDGMYRGVRFQIGLETKLNHADVAKVAAGHALNPNLNGLH